MSSVEQTATSPRMTLPPLPTVPSYADMRTCSYKESAAAEILPCLCPWKTGLHARLQNSLSQYEQLCGESCTQQAGWVVPEDDNQSGKYDLLIWDDFGLQPMDDKTRLAMLQILEERYERKSVIIASQLPIANGMIT